MGPGQGREANEEQVEPSSAVRGGLQDGCRAARSFHQAEGRHQRLRGSVYPMAGAGKGKAVREAAGEKVRIDLESNEIELIRKYE
jgi:hypothetical protein